MKLPRGMSGDQERGWFLSVHRTPRTWGPRVSVASATSVCSRLLLILFFSVSPWLLRNKICDCWKQRTWRTPRRRRKNRPQLPSFFPHQTGPPVQMLCGEYFFGCGYAAGQLFLCFTPVLSSVFARPSPLPPKPAGDSRSTASRSALPCSRAAPVPA